MPMSTVRPVSANSSIDAIAAIDTRWTAMTISTRAPRRRTSPAAYMQVSAISVTLTAELETNGGSRKKSCAGPTSGPST